MLPSIIQTFSEPSGQYLKLSIDIDGHTLSDLEKAMEEIIHAVKDGNWSHRGEKDTRHFQFDLKGPPVSAYAIAPSGSFSMLSGSFSNLDEARMNCSENDIVVGLDKQGNIINVAPPPQEGQVIRFVNIQVA